MSSTKRRVPERTCIACRQKKPKEELVRIVCTFDGRVKIDYKKNEPGRGAYLCEKRDCWEEVLSKDKKDRLGRALKTTISLEDRYTLLEQAKQLSPVSGMSKGTE